MTNTFYHFEEGDELTWFSWRSPAVAAARMATSHQFRRWRFDLVPLQACGGTALGEVIEGKEWRWG